MRAHFSLSRYQWLIDLSVGILLAIGLYMLTQTHLSTLHLQQFDADCQLMNWKWTSGFLVYLFLCRCIPFFLLILLTLRTHNHFFCHLYLGYIGFIYGTQSFLSALAYGGRGCLITFFRLLPQILFYIPALFLTWHLTRPTRRRCLLILLLWCIGMLLEGGCNPYFVQFGLKYLL